MTFSTENPFFGSIPSSIPLPNSPLTVVLMQIRFPAILSVVKKEFVADFQEQIRSSYPFYNIEYDTVLELNGNEISNESVPNWRFYDSERNWRLSLSTEFVALETRVYKSRVDFLKRVDNIVHVLSQTIQPNFITRIGMRYVDRLHGTLLEGLPRFIRPEMLSLNTQQYWKYVGQSQNEAVCQTDAGTMISRWGSMPENQSHEPILIPPIDSPSWFLDIDVFEEYGNPENFDKRKIGSCINNLAKRSYGFFRWAVNDDFLRECGGDV